MALIGPKEELHHTRMHDGKLPFATCDKLDDYDLAPRFIHSRPLRQIPKQSGSVRQELGRLASACCGKKIQQRRVDLVRAFLLNVVSDAIEQYNTFETSHSNR